MRFLAGRGGISDSKVAEGGGLLIVDRTKVPAPAFLDRQHN